MTILMKRDNKLRTVPRWLPLASGVGLIVLGLGMLLLDGSVSSGIALCGFYLLVTGAFGFVYALRNRDHEALRRPALAGLVGILAGGTAVSAPIPITIKLMVLALGGMIVGLIQMSASEQAAANGKRKESWGGFWLGVVHLILGLILISNSLLSEMVFLNLVLMWVLCGGLGLLVVAIAERR